MSRASEVFSYLVAIALGALLSMTFLGTARDGYRAGYVAAVDSVGVDRVLRSEADTTAPLSIGVMVLKTSCDTLLVDSSFVRQP